MRRWITIGSFLMMVAFSVNHNTPYVFPELPFFPPMPLSPENPLTYEGVDLGRHLFYDPILSRDSTFSCASCHRQEYAFSDGGKKLSEGIDGARIERNAMPLFNLAWYPAYFWDGRAATIEEQVFHPVSNPLEMDLTWEKATERIALNSTYRDKFSRAFGSEKIDSTLIANAIGQFLRSIVSYQSKYDQVLAGANFFTPDEYAGFILMNDMTKGDCLHCHTTDADALGTARIFSNNGLDAIYDAEKYIDKGLGSVTGIPEDNGKFKIPSLRNVGITAPYMHDGRFSTLEEVLDFYSEGVHTSANVDSKMGLAHQGGVRLSEWEKCEIISFLHTLTDYGMTQNPEYSNPFAIHKIEN